MDYELGDFLCPHLAELFPSLWTSIHQLGTYFISDKGIQFGENGEGNLSRPIEVIGAETENRNEINVLPPSDTENVQLVSNNQSTSSFKPEKGKNIFYGYN